MLVSLCVLAAVAWFVLQHRPARRRIWAHRKATFWAPFGKFLVACFTMTYQGFFRDPWRRWWTRTQAHSQVDDAINKILGRE